jgi:transposase
VGVCVESTGKISLRFVKAFRRVCQVPVSVINPKLSKRFSESLGNRDKNDPVDASIVALFGATYKPKAFRLPSEAQEKIRELNRMREVLVKDHSAWLCRLGDCDTSEAVKIAKEVIRMIEKKIQQIEKKQDEIIDTDLRMSQQVQWLNNVRFIGLITARTITAELGELAPYTRNKITAASGIYPRTYESGTTVNKKPRLVKGGGGRIRRVLYMCVTSSLSTNNPLSNYVAHLQSQGKETKCAMGAAMRKLLLICRAVVKNNGVYDESKIGYGSFTSLVSKKG